MLKPGLIVGLLLTLLVFAGGCATTGGAQGENSIFTIIIFMALLFGMYYFFMIRPQRRKQKEHQELVEDLKKGDQVITAGGIYGQIESITEDSIVVKVESGATMRVARSVVVGRKERK